MSEPAALAARPDDPVTSLEIRWMFPGELDTAVAGWFGRFPAEAQAYEDIYLLDPPLPGLSVKIRSGQAFEVKTYRGSRGSSRSPAAPAAPCGPGRNGRFPYPHGTKAGPAWRLDIGVQDPAGQPLRPGSVEQAQAPARPALVDHRIGSARPRRHSAHHPPGYRPAPFRPARAGPRRARPRKLLLLSPLAHPGGRRHRQSPVSPS